jgi:hypothetical protein
MLQAIFGKVFSLMTILSPEPGRLEAMEDRLKEQARKDNRPFNFLSGTKAKPAA